MSKEYGFLDYVSYVVLMLIKIAVYTVYIISKTLTSLLHFILRIADKALKE